MLAVQFALFAAIATLSNAVPTSLKHALHENRLTPSLDWVKGARIERGSIIPMRIGLTQTNLEKGHDYLMEVSDPASPKYGQYWSADKVHEMFAPVEESLKAVKEWLVSSGIHDSRVVHTDNKGWLAFDATVEEAESLLLTEFHEHEHRKSDKIRIGCDQYHIPEHLQPHIDYITPGIKLTPVRKRSVTVRSELLKRPNSPFHFPATFPPFDGFPKGFFPTGASLLPEDLRGCGQNMTPTCIKALYHIPPAFLAAPGNSLGLFEQGDYFAESDLEMFLETFAPNVPRDTLPIPALIDGANFSVPAFSPLNGGECITDLDLTISLIFPQTVTLYQTDDQIISPKEVADVNTFNTFLDALDGSYCTSTAFGETGNDPAIDPVYPDPAPGGFKGQLQCGVFKPTNVISASYGEAEADLPINYTMRQCNEFMKLGLQGHSILFAAGDFGVASSPGDVTASGCLGPDQNVFTPQYPSNCPYVTSVGGTMLTSDQTVNDPESVLRINLGGDAVNFSSAGGFSNYFPRPSYQESAVAKFFEIANPPYPFYSEFSPDFTTTTGLYNRIGRAYPDVAANGANLQIFLDSSEIMIFGTSLAAPIFASVLTLINEERFLIGKGPVGFVNPTLYANPEVLNDITSGHNLGCGTQGFNAVEGWDPATGLGTPNFPKMLALFLSLP